MHRSRTVVLEASVGLISRREFIAIPANRDSNRMTRTAPFDLPMKNNDEIPPTIIEPAARLRSKLSDTDFGNSRLPLVVVQCFAR